MGVELSVPEKAPDIQDGPSVHWGRVDSYG
jgi:hypothetical protein